MRAQVGRDGVVDILLGMAAAVDEPIAGGRHKVFGHHLLSVIPQTSTIASHLPRAVGIAFAIDRAAKLGVACHWPTDAVVVCSFGDASLNHATAQAALNTAAHCAHQGLPLPLLLVCEDNGLGISVPSPPGWVEGALSARAALRVEQADGDDPAGVLTVTRELGDWVRKHRRPAVLHLRTVRYLSHAGADLETAYRAAPAIRADYARDPLLATGRWLVSSGTASGEELAADYLESRGEVRALALEAMGHTQLRSAEEVMRPLAPRTPTGVAAVAEAAPWPESEALTLAQGINRGLADVLEHYPETLLFGEDVAVKGGVYGVTRGLHARFGAARVFDTLLDETSIMGLALGAAVSGFVPIPEIQYLAYLHNAEDQVRGEASTLQFFSQGRYRNGMVVRVAGYGYQRGFGGHFHNDNAVGVLRDIPGLVVASPSRPDDAASMLRTCVAAAKVDGSVCVFLEPIALYHTRDLHEEGDGLWLSELGGAHIPVGSAHTHLHGDDLTIVTLGERAAHVVAGRGATCRARRPRPGASTCAGWRRCRSTTSCARPRPRVACSWSTRRAGRAGSRKAWSPRSSTRASTVVWPAWPARTRSSRSGRPRSSCSSPRTRSKLPPWRSSPSRRRTESSDRDTCHIRVSRAEHVFGRSRRVCAIDREGSCGRVGSWRPHFPLRGAGGLSARPPCTGPGDAQAVGRYSST